MSEWNDDFEEGPDGHEGADILGVGGERDAEAEARRAALSGERLANREHFLFLANEASSNAMRMADRLQALETRLVLVDRMLRLSQPPVPGKLGVRWWRVQVKDHYRRPVLVKWQKLRNGRWRSTKVAQVRRDRINREGSAAINAEVTYKLALAASRLIKAYTETVNALAKGGRDLNRWHAKSNEALSLANVTLRVSHRSVLRKLGQAGYDIDRDAATLLDGHDLS